MAKIFLVCLALFLASFAVGLAASIIKALIQRRRAKLKETENTKELEGENRTDL